LTKPIDKPVKTLEKITEDTWNAKPLNTVIGREIVITNVEFKNAQLGEAVIIDTLTGKYYTFSRPIINQLKELQPALAETNVKATPQTRTGKAGRTYLVLE